MTHFPIRFAGLIALAGGLFLGGCGPNYPKCDQDNDCHEGEFCVNGQCQMCRSESDCPAGQMCNAGRCEARPGCQSAADCANGQECRDGQCVAPASEPTTDNTTPTSAGCSGGPIYFEFDSSTLSDSGRSSLQQVATCLSQSGGSIHVTGYTDPRGTEEYNLALGDRRARAVMQYLSSLGVNTSKVNVSSVGEEMARGEDESSWTRDRRAEITPQ